MSVWAGAAILLLFGFAAIIILWFGSRRKQRRHKQLSARVNQLKPGIRPDEATDLLRQIYDLVHDCITAGDKFAAYQAIDILKTAFGGGLFRRDEAYYLTALTVQSVRTNDPDTASALLDAFGYVLRRLPQEDLPLSIEQLGFIAAVSMKARHHFLAAKVADVIFHALERPELSEPLITSALGTIRLIGVLSLRRKDGAMFRELTVRLRQIIPATRGHCCLNAGVISLSAAWLHRIIQNNDSAMFIALVEFVDRIVKIDMWNEDEFQTLIKEWQELAGTASLNPNCLLAGEIAEFILKAAMAQARLKNWKTAVKGIAQLARTAFMRQGFHAAFPFIAPLLSAGRELLAQELKFGIAESVQSFRQQALYVIVRDCLAIAEFFARRDMVSTAGDVVTDFYRCSVECNVNSNPKAIKRFCQLLIIYWSRISKQAKKVAISDELLEPAMLSDTDKQKLQFML